MSIKVDLKQSVIVDFLVNFSAALFVLSDPLKLLSHLH
jgi:hypothetical protein